MTEPTDESTFEMTDRTVPPWSALSFLLGILGFIALLCAPPIIWACWTWAF